MQLANPHLADRAPRRERMANLRNLGKGALYRKRLGHDGSRATEHTEQTLAIHPTAVADAREPHGGMS